MLEDGTRATATSVRELLSNGVSAVALGIVGWLAVAEDPTRGVGVMLVGVGVVAVGVGAWVPGQERAGVERGSG